LLYHPWSDSLITHDPEMQDPGPHPDNRIRIRILTESLVILTHQSLGPVPGPEPPTLCNETKRFPLLVMLLQCQSRFWAPCYQAPGPDLQKHSWCPPSALWVQLLLESLTFTGTSGYFLPPSWRQPQSPCLPLCSLHLLLPPLSSSSPQ
jgi:hypothetical protein